MSRVRRAQRPALLARIANALLRRSGKPENEYLHAIAHSSRVTNAELCYQALLEGSQALPERLRKLARIRVAMRVGCPF